MTSISRRNFLQVAAAVGAAAVLNPVLRASTAAMRHATEDEPPPVRRPNILHIMTDDQDYQSFAEAFTYIDAKKRPVLDANGEPTTGYAMPYLRSMPHGGWTNFATTTCVGAICAPSRGSMLTGVTPREHGVTGNSQIKKLDPTRALPVWLAREGYRTYFSGKYSWGKPDKSFPQPPGWTIFDRYGGRSDTVFAKGAQRIRDFSQQPDQPWAMFLWTTDPHIFARPSWKNSRTRLLPPALPPNINEEDVSDKPSWVSKSKPITKNMLNGLEKERVRVYQTVMDVDDGIRRVVEALEQTGALDNTVIIFTSDNGYSWGSHRKIHKDMVYDEASRVPLMVRLPWQTENRTEERVVSHLDLVATMVDLAGATPDRDLAGKSLLPIMEDPSASWDGIAYIESHGCKDVRQNSKDRPPFSGLRTGGDAIGQFAYAEFPQTGEVEMYDMALDPYQLESVANRPEYAETQEFLRERLAQYLARPPYGQA